MTGIALTFDDGPHPVFTPRVLDALDAAGVPATFFVVGSHVTTHPRIVRDLSAAGHAVELHCGRHLRHTRNPRQTIARDTRTALHRLEMLGIRPRYWRAPWARASWTAEIAAAEGLELVDWTVDSHDWRGDTATRMLAALAPALTAGAVVLMHDGIGPGARRLNALETVRLVPRLVDGIRARGMQPAPLARVLEPSLISSGR